MTEELDPEELNHEADDADEYGFQLAAPTFDELLNEHAPSFDFAYTVMIDDKDWWSLGCLVGSYVRARVRNLSFEEAERSAPWMFTFRERLVSLYNEDHFLPLDPQPKSPGDEAEAALAGVTVNDIDLLVYANPPIPPIDELILHWQPTNSGVGSLIVNCSWGALATLLGSEAVRSIKLLPWETVEPLPEWVGDLWAFLVTSDSGDLPGISG